MALYPRLLAHVIARTRITQWLCEPHELPLRLLIAPNGFGKTTALVHYAQSQPQSYFVSFHGLTSPETLTALLAEALDKDGAGYRAIIAELEARQPCEVIFDGVEALDAGASNLIERLTSEVPPGVTILAAGTRTAIDIARYSLRGFAKVLAPEQLLFTGPEIQRLGAALKLDFNDEYALDVRERTDGWPIVVSDVMRLASTNAIDFFEAYDRWLMTQGEAFLGIVQAELSTMSAAARESFDVVMHGNAPTYAQIQTLVANGAPIVRDLESARILRVLADIAPRVEGGSIQTADPLRIRMFGRFTIRSADHEVQWIRRRDQQLVRYLLLRPEGRADRNELLQIFWPDSEPALAAQSLRTACSNIRKALTQVIGREAADIFFQADHHEITVNAAKAVVDLYRFRIHDAAAREAELSDAVHDALAHAAAAVRIYRADLFAGEPPEPWFIAQREVYRESANAIRIFRDRLRSESTAEALSGHQ